MNHDITFCGNSDECPKAPTCRRAHPPTDVTVSLAAFYLPDGDCEFYCYAYWPTGEVK
jgi:hypothetical protein